MIRPTGSYDDFIHILLSTMIGIGRLSSFQIRNMCENIKNNELQDKINVELDGRFAADNRLLYLKTSELPITGDEIIAFANKENIAIIPDGPFTDENGNTCYERIFIQPEFADAFFDDLEEAYKKGFIGNQNVLKDGDFKYTIKQWQNEVSKIEAQLSLTGLETNKYDEIDLATFENSYYFFDEPVLFCQSLNIPYILNEESNTIAINSAFTDIFVEAMRKKPYLVCFSDLSEDKQDDLFEFFLKEKGYLNNLSDKDRDLLISENKVKFDGDDKLYWKINHSDKKFFEKLLDEIGDIQKKSDFFINLDYLNVNPEIIADIIIDLGIDANIEDNFLHIDESDYMDVVDEYERRRQELELYNEELSRDFNVDNVININEDDLNEAEEDTENSEELDTSEILTDDENKEDLKKDKEQKKTNKKKNSSKNKFKQSFQDTAMYTYLEESAKETEKIYQSEKFENHNIESDNPKSSDYTFDESVENSEYINDKRKNSYTEDYSYKEDYQQGDSYKEDYSYEEGYQQKDSHTDDYSYEENNQQKDSYVEYTPSNNEEYSEEYIEGVKREDYNAENVKINTDFKIEREKELYGQEVYFNDGSSVHVENGKWVDNNNNIIPEEKKSTYFSDHGGVSEQSYKEVTTYIKEESKKEQYRGEYASSKSPYGYGTGYSSSYEKKYSQESVKHYDYQSQNETKNPFGETSSTQDYTSPQKTESQPSYREEFEKVKKTNEWINNANKRNLDSKTYDGHTQTSSYSGYKGSSFDNADNIQKQPFKFQSESKYASKYGQQSLSSDLLQKMQTSNAGKAYNINPMPITAYGTKNSSYIFAQNKINAQITPLQTGADISSLIDRKQKLQNDISLNIANRADSQFNKQLYFSTINRTLDRVSPASLGNLAGSLTAGVVSTSLADTPIEKSSATMSVGVAFTKDITRIVNQGSIVANSINQLNTRINTTGGIEYMQNILRTAGITQVTVNGVKYDLNSLTQGVHAYNKDIFEAFFKEYSSGKAVIIDGKDALAEIKKQFDSILKSDKNFERCFDFKATGRAINRMFMRGLPGYDEIEETVDYIRKIRRAAQYTTRFSSKLLQASRTKFLKLKKDKLNALRNKRDSLLRFQTGTLNNMLSQYGLRIDMNWLINHYNRVVSDNTYIIQLQRFLGNKFNVIGDNLAKTVNRTGKIISNTGRRIGRSTIDKTPNFVKRKINNIANSKFANISKNAINSSARAVNKVTKGVLKAPNKFKQLADKYNKAKQEMAKKVLEKLLGNKVVMALTNFISSAAAVLGVVLIAYLIICAICLILIYLIPLSSESENYMKERLLCIYQLESRLYDADELFGANQELGINAFSAGDDIKNSSTSNGLYYLHNNKMMRAGIQYPVTSSVGDLFKVTNFDGSASGGAFGKYPIGGLFRFDTDFCTSLQPFVDGKDGEYYAYKTGDNYYLKGFPYHDKDGKYFEADPSKDGTKTSNTLENNITNRKKAQMAKLDKWYHRSSASYATGRNYYDGVVYTPIKSDLKTKTALNSNFPSIVAMTDIVFQNHFPGNDKISINNNNESEEESESNTEESNQPSAEEQEVELHITYYMEQLFCLSHQVNLSFNTTSYDEMKVNTKLQQQLENSGEGTYRVVRGDREKGPEIYKLHQSKFADDKTIMDLISDPASYLGKETKIEDPIHTATGTIDTANSESNAVYMGLDPCDSTSIVIDDKLNHKGLLVVKEEEEEYKKKYENYASISAADVKEVKNDVKLLDELADFCAYVHGYITLSDDAHGDTKSNYEKTISYQYEYTYTDNSDPDNPVTRTATGYGSVQLTYDMILQILGDEKIYLNSPSDYEEGFGDELNGHGDFSPKLRNKLIDKKIDKLNDNKSSIEELVREKASSDCGGYTVTLTDFNTQFNNIINYVRDLKNKEKNIGDKVVFECDLDDSKLHSYKHCGGHFFINIEIFTSQLNSARNKDLFSIDNRWKSINNGPDTYNAINSAYGDNDSGLAKFYDIKDPNSSNTKKMWEDFTDGSFNTSDKSIFGKAVSYVDNIKNKWSNDEKQIAFQYNSSSIIEQTQRTDNESIQGIGDILKNSHAISFKYKYVKSANNQTYKIFYPSYISGGAASMLGGIQGFDYAETVDIGDKEKYLQLSKKSIGILNDVNPFGTGDEYSSTGENTEDAKSSHAECDIVSVALDAVGNIGYYYAGSSKCLPQGTYPTGLDCSGFVSWVICQTSSLYWNVNLQDYYFDTLPSSFAYKKKEIPSTAVLDFCKIYKEVNGTDFMTDFKNGFFNGSSSYRLNSEGFGNASDYTSVSLSKNTLKAGDILIKDSGQATAITSSNHSAIYVGCDGNYYYYVQEGGNKECTNLAKTVDISLKFNKAVRPNMYQKINKVYKKINELSHMKKTNN